MSRLPGHCCDFGVKNCIQRSHHAETASGRSNPRLRCRDAIGLVRGARHQIRIALVAAGDPGTRLRPHRVPREVCARSLPLATRRLQIVPARLGDRAGTVGLAGMLTDNIFDIRRVDASFG